MILIMALAALSSYLGIGMLLRLLKHQQLMLDIPNERSSHSQPIPRGGGMIIVLLSLSGIMLFTLLYQPEDMLPVGLLVLGGFCVAIVSWRDDIRPLSNRVRFATHIFAAILVVIALASWRQVTLPFVNSTNLGWLGIPLTIIWVVGLINAYNFMDGIDGLAGGVAVVAGLGWALIGWYLHVPMITIFGVILAASSLGFLGHNWHPARIFMGDVGSAYLGYAFAVMPLLALFFLPNQEQSNALTVFFIGILLVWPFLFDTVFTISRRLLNGEKVWTAHRSHLYQRLVINGYPHHVVALLYIGLAFCGLISALALVLDLPGSIFILLIWIPLLCVALWRFVLYKESSMQHQFTQYEKR
ncbi:MAG: glycosyltransferase family 4 protein [Anaerolineales bacterium]|nr:glycosyltransferase family 4 protein [Anaerolineales bacterium]